MRNKNIIVSTLIIAELIAIFLLGTKAYNKQNNTAMIVNPIKKEQLLFSNGGILEHFYESVPNKVIEEQWEDRVVTYTINSDTLNERFEYTVDKPKDTFRIISLGDSWTYGLGVDTQYNYSEVLEDLLNNNLRCKNFKKFEVINLGLYGYDIEYSVERFRVRGQKYNPDLIVWFVRNDDFGYQKFLNARIEFYESKFGTRPDVGSSVDAGGAAFEAMNKKFEEEKMAQYE